MADATRVYWLERGQIAIATSNDYFNTFIRFLELIPPIKHIGIRSIFFAFKKLNFSFP